MSNTDIIREVLLKFTEPYLAIGETNHDKEAYYNLLAICYIHDYCYDLIRENAELKGNEYSIVQAREVAIRHISDSIVCMRDLPSVTPERPKAKWITWKEAGNYIPSETRFECSVCHDAAQTLCNGLDLLSPYCPNCGAEMEVENE